MASQIGRLERVLGLTFGLAVTIGVTIGAGILRRPGAVAGALGEPSLILLMWALGGVYALLAALAVAELATAVPLAGGFFVWSRRALGPGAGFSVGWCDFLANCASVAFCAVAVTDLIPWLEGPQKRQMAAAALVLLFAGIQWKGIREGSHTQKITSALLAGAYLALVASAFLLGSGAKESVAVVRREFALGTAGALVFAFQSIVVAYDGWYQPAYFAEEILEPGRNLPRSMLAGVVTVGAVYLLINCALLYVLPLGRLAASEMPASDLAHILFGANAGRWITALSILALLPSINAALLSATRILYGLAREKLFWANAGAVRRGGTPHIALILAAATVMALLLTGSFERLLGMGGFFMVFMYCSAYVSLFVLRRREPQLARPFRVPGYPWVPGILLVSGGAFLAGAVASDTRSSLLAMASLGACAPVYLLLCKLSRSR
ncbi:MAG: APC family permease [Acidobacteria bacterium]|nr:APC family permease [Acidobacteriota bacterium]